MRLAEAKSQRTSNIPLCGSRLSRKHSHDPIFRFLPHDAKLMGGAGRKRMMEPVIAQKCGMVFG
jgi:hypothetical protein